MSGQRTIKFPALLGLKYFPIVCPCGKLRVLLGVIRVDDNVRGGPPLDQRPTTISQVYLTQSHPELVLSLFTSLRFAV